MSELGAEEAVVSATLATGKVALITGANRGIGFEVARQLGTLGATVLIGSRHEARGSEAEHESERNRSTGERSNWM